MHFGRAVFTALSSVRGLTYQNKRAIYLLLIYLVYCRKQCVMGSLAAPRISISCNRVEMEGGRSRSRTGQKGGLVGHMALDGH